MCPHCGQAIDEHCLCHNLGNWPMGSLTRCPAPEKWPNCGPTPPPPTLLPAAYSCGCYDEATKLYLGPSIYPNPDTLDKAWMCSLCAEKPQLVKPPATSPMSDEP